MHEKRNIWNMLKDYTIKKLFWVTNKVTLKHIIVLLFTIIILTLSICFYGKIYVCKGNINSYLADKQYETILGYRTLCSYNDFHLVKVNRYNGLKEYEDLFDKSDSDDVKFNSICNYINRFKYNENQHDPQLIGLYGGNCQAKSLMARDYFNLADLDNELILSKDLTHMYNRVKVNNIWYDLDLTEGTIQEYTKKGQ